MSKVWVIVARDGEYSEQTWEPLLVVGNHADASAIHLTAEEIRRAYEADVRAQYEAHRDSPRPPSYYEIRCKTLPRYNAMIQDMGLGNAIADGYELHEVEYRP